ncbi:hypothetical protein SAMN02746066_04372 [Anaerosporobacter mobilis DSM 15930]|jgi:hypothetical protein|uniref:Uncharacterized protein n=1 Tax=Anaerosporobacter mobilis DSM 15930 TaxID=1120996 RepID=A0A1M7NDN5_9FIRM|nr:hypothetical protein [Anaerosporobacter mobilis]SHN01424.1 hypothetical protein SAMN02746066_04372 [Anaerosporobacter mobilis DSM 15930]
MEEKAIVELTGKASTLIHLSEDYETILEDENTYSVRNIKINTNDENLQAIVMIHKLKDGHYRNSTLDKSGVAYLSQKY